MMEYRILSDYSQKKFKKYFFLFLALCIFLTGYGQVVGDYRSNLGGVGSDGDWTVLASWQRCNSISPATWAVPTAGQGYPGQFAGTGKITILAGDRIIHNANIPYAIGSLDFAGTGTGNTTLARIATDYDNYTLNISGDVNLNYGRIASIDPYFGTINIGGDLYINNTSYVREVFLTVDGTTTINPSSSLILDRTPLRQSLKIFKGLVTNNGTWDNASGYNIEFQGGLANNGTFSTNTENYAFSTNSQNISGSQPIIINGSTDIDPGVGHTVTLQRAITVSPLSISSGTLDAYQQITGDAGSNFSMAANTFLSLGDPGSSSNILFPTAFTNANISLASASTVIYQNNSTQTVSNVPTYANLIIATGGTKNLTNSTTLNGNLSVEPGSTFNLGTTATTLNVAGTATINGTINYNGTTTKTVTIGNSLSGSGTIDMSGGSRTHTLNLGGANNAIGNLTTAAVTSVINYNRIGNQQIFASPNYRDLTVSGGGTKTLQGDVTVGNNLNISNGLVDVYNADLTIIGSIPVYDAARYVIAQNNGTLIQNVVAANKVFPVGTSTSYIPLILNNSGTADNYSVNVFSTVTDNGLSGGSPVGFLEDCVKKSWRVGEALAGGSNLTLTTQWILADEGSTFSRSKCAIGYHNGITWIRSTPSAAGGTGPYTQTLSGVLGTGCFAVMNGNYYPVITSNGGGATATISVSENTTAITTVTATDADVPAQTLTYSISGTDAAKFSIISTTGVLTFTTAPDYETPDDAGNNNVYDVQVTVTDNGTGNLTDVQNIAVTVTDVNEAPIFTKGADQSILEDAGAQSIASWATGISDGDPSMVQTLTFNVTNDNNALFSSQPAINAAGTLSYTPAANPNGSATVTVTLSDNGSSVAPNVNTSAAQTFTISVSAVNDVPVFTKGGDQSVLEDAGAQSIAAWATGITDGDPELTQTLTLNVSNDNNALFSSQPAINAAGTLTYTPAANANGSATVTVTLAIRQRFP
jgi:hypothetical protein